MCGMQGGDKPKTGWLNKAVALTAAVLTGDNEMAMSLADRQMTEDQLSSQMASCCKV